MDNIERELKERPELAKAIKAVLELPKEQQEALIEEVSKGKDIKAAITSIK